MDIEKLSVALKKSWSVDTSYGGMATTENPARGQCVVSSLIIQDYLEGELVKFNVSGRDFQETHYANLLGDGTLIDTTAQQYENMDVVFRRTKIDLKGEYDSIRAKRLDDEDTRKRYEILRARVEDYLATSS